MVPYWVLFSTWALPSQPYSRHEKRRWGRYCPPLHGRVGGTSSHPRSAGAVSLGVRLRIRSHLCGLWSRAEYRPSPYPRTSAASAQSRLSQRLRPRD